MRVDQELDPGRSIFVPRPELSETLDRLTDRWMCLDLSDGPITLAAWLGMTDIEWARYGETDMLPMTYQPPTPPLR